MNETSSCTSRFARIDYHLKRLKLFSIRFSFNLFSFVAPAYPSGTRDFTPSF
jgi:hypothetical protein